jgi:DNA invertase Pin-like site-specific DNA recombinase
VAQFEREMTLERQREGIARAKAKGKYKGRKPTVRAKAQDAVRLFFGQGTKVAHIATELGIGRGSVYRALESAGVARKSFSYPLPPPWSVEQADACFIKKGAETAPKKSGP